MITEIRFKNLLSFRDEAVFSFEADNSKDMEFYYVVDLALGIRQLKLAVVYGANLPAKVTLLKYATTLRSF